MTNSKIDIFNNWLIDNGSKLSNIHIKQYNNIERGVHASENISQHKRVVSIPLKLLIHSGMGYETIYSSEIESSKKNAYFKDDNIMYVLFYMLQEYIKGDESFYKPYLDILPKDLSHFPIFWKDEYISYLHNTDIPRLIKERLERFLHDFNLAKNTSEIFNKHCTKDLFLWLRCIIGSRNFGLNIGGINRSVMAPLGDMLNHSNDHDVKWGFDNTDGVYFMDSIKGISKNSEIFDSYGLKQNTQYLLYYGFTLPYDNMPLYTRSETHNLEINYNTHEELSAEKLKKIQPKNIIKISKNNSNNILMDQIMPYIRTCVADSNELLDHNTIINPINELKALLTSKYIVQQDIDNLASKLSKLVNKNIPFHKDNFISNILENNKLSLQNIITNVDTKITNLEKENEFTKIFKSL